jgi:anti-anti-sigma factor
MEPQENPFELHTEGDVCIVRVSEPKMAYATLEALQSKLYERIANDVRKMVINLEKAAFIDSFGLGVLVATSRRMQKANGQMKLCGVGERVAMSLRITRLDLTLDIVDSEEEAIRSLDGEA